MRRTIEPINSTGRVTPLATSTRMLGFALRDAVGGKEAAIAACRACIAAVNECNSRAADIARQNR
eukprot:4146104-Pleurochrysis_carterae.AAC.1